MKKIFPKKGEVAKEVAKTLAKVVGRSLAISGGVAALGFGIAGCESAPPAPVVPTQVINGVIVDSYHGNSYISGNTGTYYIVDQDGNIETKEDQKLFYVGDTVSSKYPGIKVGAEIVFRWDAESERLGLSSVGDLVSVNRENPR
jgi:hypothetical protein